MLQRQSLDLQPLFIVGSPRSGTTLLAGLLRDTPWGEAFETHFITKYHGRLARYGDLQLRRGFTALVRDILAERPIAQRQPALDPDSLYDTLDVRDFASITHAIGLACMRAQSTSSWGDKTPHYIRQIGVLHELFPRSRMLYITRDGRDVALSLMRKSWGPANVFSCAEQWARENAPQPIVGHLAARGLLHQLRYEDLLTDPEAVLGRALAFLGQTVTDEALRRMTANVRRDNSQKWKQEMSPDQIDTFERVASATLTRLGYEVERGPRPVRAASVAAYRAHDLAKHAHNLFVMNVVDTIRIHAFGKQPFAE